MRLCVAIPCDKVTRHVLGIISAIDPEVHAIYAIDDACPEGSGRLIEAQCHDPRVRVLYHAQNQGVGGAIVTAYQATLADSEAWRDKSARKGAINGLLTGFVWGNETTRLETTK